MQCCSYTNLPIWILICPITAESHQISTLSLTLFLLSPPRPPQVLLLVDASFGFEMEAFEFLNILQVHGFPKVMGILTHLDMINSAKAQRKTKKQLKQRFWTEIYQVCWFTLHGVLYHGHLLMCVVSNLDAPVVNVTRLACCSVHESLIWHAAL